jgi:hypothetical protein
MLMMELFLSLAQLNNQTIKNLYQYSDGASFVNRHVSALIRPNLNTIILTINNI